MALSPFHTILSTEAGNLSTPVNYVFGDIPEAQVEKYVLTQAKPVLIVSPFQVDTNFSKHDQVLDRYTVTFLILKYMPLGGKQVDRGADLNTLLGLGQEFIHRIRKNANIVAATYDRDEVDSRCRPLYNFLANDMFGYEVTFRIAYQYNCNPLNE